MRLTNYDTGVRVTAPLLIVCSRQEEEGIACQTMSACIACLHGYNTPHSPGKRVVRLEYECYLSMAEKEMRKICSAVREKWAVRGVALLHRLG